VRLVTEQGLSLAQAARDLGIDDNLLGRWKKELEAQGAKAFPGQGHLQDAALARLRREVEVLRQEREVLKKPSLFSRKSQGNLCHEVSIHSDASPAVSPERAAACVASEFECISRLVPPDTEPTGTARSGVAGAGARDFSDE